MFLKPTCNIIRWIPESRTTDQDVNRCRLRNDDIRSPWSDINEREGLSFCTNELLYERGIKMTWWKLERTKVTQTNIVQPQTDSQIETVVSSRVNLITEQDETWQGCNLQKLKTNNVREKLGDRKNMKAETAAYGHGRHKRASICFHTLLFGGNGTNPSKKSPK